MKTGPKPSDSTDSTDDPIEEIVQEKRLDQRCPWYYFKIDYNHSLAQRLSMYRELLGHQERGKIRLDYTRTYMSSGPSHAKPRGKWDKVEGRFPAGLYYLFQHEDTEEFYLEEVEEKGGVKFQLQIKVYHRLKREEALMMLWENRD